MKKILFFALLIGMILGSCTQEKKSPLEGAWKVVSFNAPSINATMPGNTTGEELKVWTKTHFAFTGTFKMDTVVMDNYGWGTYTLEGNKYIEQVSLHSDKTAMGQTIKILLELKNDTVTQRWPVDDNWNLAETHYIQKLAKVE